MSDRVSESTEREREREERETWIGSEKVVGALRSAGSDALAQEAIAFGVVVGVGAKLVGKAVDVVRALRRRPCAVPTHAHTHTTR